MAGSGWLHHQGPAGKKGGAGEAEATGANPTDRGKCGSKRHLLTEGGGIPLAVVLSGANRTDMKKLGDLLDVQLIEEAAAVVPEMGGEEIAEERHLCLDRGYATVACWETAEAHGYVPHIPPKRSAAEPIPPPGDPARHPPRRWVVEVSHSWFNRFRRLLVRWEKKGANYLGFVQLAACLIIYRKLRHARSLTG
jgi:putative transposase